MLYYSVLLLLIGTNLLFSITICQQSCLPLDVVAICLPPLVICINNNTQLNPQFPGFSIELLNSILTTANPQLYCPQYSLTIVSNQVDFFLYFQNHTSSNLLGIPAISNSELTNYFMKPSLPYTRSVIRAYGLIGDDILPIQLIVLQFFLQPIFWEFLFAYLLLTLLYCNIVWCLERHINSDNFPKSYLVGIFDSFYFSSVTTATVGYGDKVTRSLFGKIMVLFWMLASFLIVLLFGSVATSTLTISQLRNVPQNVYEFTGKSASTIAFTRSAELLTSVGASLTFVMNQSSIQSYFSTYKTGYLVYDQIVLASNFSNLITSRYGLIGPNYGITEYSYLLPKNTSQEYMDWINEWLLRVQHSPQNIQWLVSKYLQQVTPPLNTTKIFLNWLPTLVLGSVVLMVVSVYLFSCCVEACVKRKIDTKKTIVEPLPSELQTTLHTSTA